MIQDAKTFLKRVFEEFGKDQVSFLAAAIAFYAWMSIFPLLLAAVAALGMWLGSAEARETALQLLNENLPVLRTSGVEFEEILTGIADARGSVGIIGLIGLLWTGMQVILATEVALNKVFDVEKREGFLQLRLKALLYVLAAAVVFTISLGSGLLLNLLPSGWLTRAGGWLLGVIITGVLFAIAFRVLPRVKIEWSFAFAGGLVTSVLWHVANTALVFYFANFGRFNAVYGSLASVVIVLLACYYMALVTLIGAEVTYVAAERYGGRIEPETQDASA